ncbi:MAG: sensor histidine kinase [Candidatus Halalkalibacterium sp. M3_1C_030]
MNQHLQKIFDFIEQSDALSEEEMVMLLKWVKSAENDLMISEFKLERTEKVKKTTAILLEETIEELEKKREVVEKSRTQLQQSLEELEAAKDQLVQQEKLASLGQLTAGIAHEIKNPLNFVNNFSELSIELIEEAKEEVRIQESVVRSDKSEILELLDDIKMNLLKIHEHGSRADSIVKSMLQHSKGGSGTKEPTELNRLIEEYLNLSFHGMRASPNPINVDLNLDLDETVGMVELNPEDISRVLINLFNNAFDAMREKANQNSELKIKNYSPRLTVRTYQKGSNVTIEIEDNGPGIPEELRDKIMQPFFTTKKGTEGTGLGLSISNDIIKAHGGHLEVSAGQKEGTIFTINLFPGRQT